MMFRNQTRRGIRAVQAGSLPVGLCRNGGGLIATYCNDTVVHSAPHTDPAIDRQRMRETGRQLAESYLRDPPLLVSDTSSEPAAGDGAVVEKVVATGERLNTDLPDVRWPAFT
jgi:hypothetical protein